MKKLKKSENTPCFTPMCPDSLNGMLRKDLFEAAPKLHMATLSAQPVLFAADAAGKAPEWIPLIPAGQLIIARDGRTFIPDHQTAIDNFNKQGLPIPLDWDHSLDSWGVAPGEMKAAAWIDKLESRDGALWGHIENWTAKGRDSVESKEYRFISPVIQFNDERRVVDVPRASLVNNPALVMPSLFNQKDRSMHEKIVALLQTFGLDITAPTEEAIAHVAEIFAKGQAPVVEAVVDLTTHVPVEQYEAVVAELAQVKAQVESYAEQNQKAKVESVIKGALHSGRLLPSERAFFEAQAHKDLPGVEAFLASRAPLISGGKAAPTPVQTDDGLSEAELKMAAKSGLTPQAFAAAKARTNTQKV